MTIADIGYWLAAAQALALCAIAVAVWIAPGFAAKSYGITLDTATTEALLRGLGMRDLALALAIGVALRMHPPAVPWLLLATAPVALTDYYSVSRLGGPQLPRSTHLAGALGLLVTAALLFFS